MSDPATFTLVTGASSGIGRAVALRLSRQRALILHGRNTERLEEIRRSCANAERHATWQYDFESVEGLNDSLVPLLAQSHRAVDAFVHCAGTVTVLPMKSVNHKTVRAVMDVNVLSAVEIINVLLRRSANGPNLKNIVFISSIFSRFGARGHSAYCASKAALDGLMRALAVELAPPIRVNSILPGAVRTEMAAGAFADEKVAAKIEQDYPLGPGQPDDIASLVEFVISDEARWLTGQQLVVDGGRTVNMSLK